MYPMHTASHFRSVIRFGVFEADVLAGELRKNGVKVKIQDLPFRALKLLLNHPNEVLSREQFRQALWPKNVFVDFDHGISSAINRLRDALGDSADNPVFIETVERRGYRWIAPTHMPSPPPVQPRPVLVMPEVAPPGEDSNRLHRGSLWWLLLPAAVLLLAVWVFRPKHTAAVSSGGHLLTAPRTAAAPGHPANSDAEQFYLKGRFYWEKRTPDGLNKAVDFFTQAIVHDPNYAPAYVGLGDCYNLMREYTLMPASEAYPRALAAAQKAVELDDQSSEAHASLAFALFWGTWNVKDAEREFRRALELNPNNAVAHHWYATYLSTVGRLPESVQEIERAQALDPASKSIVADKGDLLWVAGRRDEGTALLKQLEATEPDFISPHRYLKSIYLDTEDYPLYLEEWRKEAGLMQDSSSLKLVGAAEKGFASTGVRGMLENIRELQLKMYARGQLSPYHLAQTNSLLGNKQEALRYLKIAYDKHDEFAFQVMHDTAFNSLHADPGYQALIAQLGIPGQN
jgi:DNA-binding winged helix-turn-helix (wHTH) protein/Tfp pilus assembly protein PilF